jgi:hypothetical protein
LVRCVVEDGSSARDQSPRAAFSVPGKFAKILLCIDVKQKNRKIHETKHIKKDQHINAK